MPLRMGEYRHRLILQKRTETRDAAGQPIRAYTQFSIRWAKANRRSGGEGDTQSTRRNVDNAEWRMHQTQGVGPKMRLLAPMSATTLGTAVVSAADTTWTVADVSGFPLEGNFRVRAANEVVEVTAGQGTVNWTVTRGVDGTTAATAYAIGQNVQHMEAYDITSAMPDEAFGAETVVTARRVDGGS